MDPRDTERAPDRVTDESFDQPGDRALATVLGGPSSDRPTVDLILGRLAEVEVAHEALRVAEEDIRVQRAQIAELLLQHDAELRWRGQMTALLPIGLCVTDREGVLIVANPALAAQLGARLPRLRGRPLSDHLADEDVPGLRATLRSLDSGAATEARLEVTVRSGRVPPAHAHLFGFAETPDRASSPVRVQWVLVPQGDETRGPEPQEDEGRTRAHESSHAREDEEPLPTSQVVWLATSLAELSALPAASPDRRRLFDRMAALVRGVVPGADWVSVTIGSPQTPQRLGSDSAEAQACDGWQLQAGEGPCWEAHRTSSVVVTDDVTTDPRWPALAPLAAAGRVRAVLAVALQEGGRTTGVLHVHAGSPAAFGSAGRGLAEVAAAAVAGVLQALAEREALQALTANLEKALTSRAVIDQAKGMVMARLGVSADDAFARLVGLSSRLNVKVRHLAALTVEGHIDAVLRTED